MKYTLTSWKEIAQYVGKGVRTVQRWERQLGLPVRRPNLRNRGIVLASSEEIDGWLGSITQGNADSEEMHLRQKIAELTAENAHLRRELARLANQQDGNGAFARNSDGDLVGRYMRALEKNTEVRLSSAESVEMSRNLRMLREMEHAGWAQAIGLFRDTLSDLDRAAAIPNQRRDAALDQRRAAAAPTKQ